MLSYLWRVQLIGLLLCGMTAYGKIKLPSVIGSDMVLQQQSAVPLWGNSSSNAAVRVTTSWDHKTYNTHADAAGHWRVKVVTPRAGGPFEITFSDGTALTLKGILIGEVWVCSGQSNMEMPMEGFVNTPILHANDILMQADNPQLRLFHVRRAVSNTPLADCEGSWVVSSPENARSFSAVGFQFAQMLQHALHVPVGIIEAAWGGTPIEAWMTKNSLQAFTDIKIPVEGDTVKADRLRPICLFNGMIAPVAGFSIKGFLWYQGEANVARAGSHPYNYDKMMAAMIEAWRKLWQQDTLPFYYVQIAPWVYRNNRDSVAYLRDAQRRAQQEIPRSGMVVSIDAGNEFTIHPPDKTIISKRLLYWALGDAYHKRGIAYRSPEYEDMQVKDSTAIIRFTDASQGFTSWDKEISGFEVAGPDKVFYPAKARIFKKSIRVKSEQVAHPVAVRYAFKDWVTGNLYNTSGLPVGPFRTDHW